MNEKIENLLKESEGMPERCPECFIESHGMIKHEKGCSIGEMQKEDGWSIEIISKSGETDIEPPDFEKFKDY